MKAHASQGSAGSIDGGLQQTLSNEPGPFSADHTSVSWPASARAIMTADAGPTQITATGEVRYVANTTSSLVRANATSVVEFSVASPTEVTFTAALVTSTGIQSGGGVAGRVYRTDVLQGVADAVWMGSANPDPTANFQGVLQPGTYRFELSAGWSNFTVYQNVNGKYNVTATLTVVNAPPTCGTSDFNGDGDIGTDQDIEAFFACLGGSCCDTCYEGGADFNGDGDTGTDQDIESFFRVLGGGAC
ncbi:MAG TPA: hypothetical protein VD997_13485 [Phycisphaerales bacterium]|nr:hypothetical protein [Phycisphaerales bacterium]